MIIYIVVFLISISCILLSERTGTGRIGRKILVFIALVVPSILAAVRDYTIGRDVLIYGNAWFKKAVETQDLIKYLQAAGRGGIGYGYAFLNYLVSIFTDNPHWFYFILALLEMTILYFALKPYKDRISIAYGFFVYFFIYYNDSLNTLRQMPAILLVLLSFSFVRKRKLVLFVLTIGGAMLFHITAVVGFIIYPLAILAESKLKKIINIGIFIIMLVGVLNFAYIVDFLNNLNFISLDRYSHYITSDDVSGGRMLRIALLTILFILFFVSKEKLSVKYKEINSLFMYMIFSCVLTLLLFIFSSAYIIRIANYYDIFMVLYVPYIVKALKIRFGESGTAPKYILCGSVFFVYWLIVYVIRNGANTVPFLFMK